MSVHLSQASVKLMKSETNCSEVQLLFDFEFQNVKVEHECRSGSYMFSLRLRDKNTSHFLFPLLLSPQSSEDALLCHRCSQNRFTSPSFIPPALGHLKKKMNLSLTFSMKRIYFPPELTTMSMSRASHWNWILSTTPLP